MVNLQDGNEDWGADGHDKNDKPHHLGIPISLLWTVFICLKRDGMG